MKKAGNTKSEPIRILQIGMHDQVGGIETFLMNYYRNINRNKVQFDFISIHDTMCFEEQIRDLGGNVFHLPSPKKHPIKHYKSLLRIMSKGNYKAVHVHMRSAANILPILAGKQRNIHTIVHSHSSNMPSGAIRKILHYINLPFIKLADELFSCSDKAGKWLFGKSNFTIIQNAVDSKKLKYNTTARNNFRKRFNIPKDKFVIGHIGRFEEEKNHEYIIKVFQKICKTNPDSMLILAGTGSQLSTIQSLVNEYQLEKKVIFTGPLTNPSDFYSAIDIFIMPSLFEGFPMAGVEAQLSGAQCIFSNTITKEISINSNTFFLPTNISDIELWQKQINSFRKNKSNTKQRIAANQNKKYNIKNAAQKLTNYYQSIHTKKQSKKINHFQTIFFIGYALTVAAEMLYTVPPINSFLPALNLIGMACILVYVCHNLYQNKNAKQTIFFTILMLLSLITYLMSNDTIPLKIYLLLFATIGFGFTKCINMDYGIRLILLITVVTLSLFGITQNRNFIRLDGSIRYTFGFAHPNAFGIYSTILVLEKLFLDYSNKQKLKQNVFATIIVILVNLFLTNSRTICMILAIILIIYLLPRNSLKKFFYHPLTKIIIKYCMIYFTVISFCLVSIAYMDSNFATAINKFLSYRPKFYSVFFQKYGLSILGSEIPDSIAGMPLDNAYLTIIFKYGFIQYLILLIISILTFKQLFIKKEYFLNTIFFLILAYGVMETSAIKPGINPFILALSYGIKKDEAAYAR